MEIDFSAMLTGLVAISLKVIIALVIFAVGRWLSGPISRWVRSTMDQRGADEAVARMLTTLTRIAVILTAIAIALATVGIQTTALAALVASLGLAVGLALQGALANFAGGVLILTFQPFRIGDLVQIDGYVGKVEDIQLVNTVLVTDDRSRIIIPNGQVSNGTVINYSTAGGRRVDLVFGISYDDDLLRAKEILIDLVTSDPRVLKEPAPEVRVLELGDSSVNFAVRPFVKIPDYFDVYFDLTEQVKLRFDAEGVSMPYPQRDVHLIPVNGGEQS